VENDVRTERGDRPGQHVDVEHVADHGLRAEVAQQVSLVRRARHPGDHVPARHQQRQQANADHTARARDEDPHNTTA
jgi:hypothetical protein